MKSAGLLLLGCKGGFVLSQALFPGLEAASARADFAPKLEMTVQSTSYNQEGCEMRGG